MQAAPPEDESLLGNWLPVQGQPFHPHLRVYLPAQSLLDGEWQTPTIKMV